MTIRLRAPSYKWRLVAVLFLAASLNYADRGALTAVFPLLKKDLGMSDLALAAIGSFFLWSYALFSPLAGFIGDRFSRSVLITWSLAAWSLVTAVTGLVSSSEWLLGMRVLLGIAESVYIPAALALIADHHDARSRATAMGIHLSGIYVGVVLSSTVAGFLGDHFGWRPSLYVLGGAGFLLAIICHITLRDASPLLPGKQTSEPQSTTRASAAKVLLTLARTPSFLILLGEAAFVSIGLWIFANWLPLYFTETFKMSLGGAGFSGTFPIQAGSVVGILAGGYLSDRVSKKLVSRRMLLHSLFYLMSAPFLLTFVWSLNIKWILLSIFVFSLLRSLGAANANPLLCDLLPGKSRSTAIGLMNTTNTLAGGTGILVAGYLKRDFGLGGVFAGISVILLLCGVLLLVGYGCFLNRDLARLRDNIR